MNKQKTYKLEIHHYLTPSAQFFFRRTMASTIYFFLGARSDHIWMREWSDKLQLLYLMCINKLMDSDICQFMQMTDLKKYKNFPQSWNTDFLDHDWYDCTASRVC